MRRFDPVPVIEGFEHINRYWDWQADCWAVKILPGELYVTANPDEVICTTLGSCVSACIRDIQSGIGGMNHFMLPDSEHDGIAGRSGRAARYGRYAMEQLINTILKTGGQRQNLEMKVCGGAWVLKQMANTVAAQNIEFVLNYARDEKIHVVAQDLGGEYPRKVMYYPQSGRMRIKRLRALHNETVMECEADYGAKLEDRLLYGKEKLLMTDHKR